MERGIFRELETEKGIFRELAGPSSTEGLSHGPRTCVWSQPLAALCKTMFVAGDKQGSAGASPV